jgi:hypothetical protein
MRVARVLGVSILIAVCSALASPGWANGGESGGTACEVYPTRMDPKVGEWAFVTVCEAENGAPLPVLRIGARDLPLKPVNTATEGTRVAVLWVVRDVVDNPAEAIQLVFPQTGQVVPVSRFDAKAIPRDTYVAGKVLVTLRGGVVEFPLGERGMPAVAISEVPINDPGLARWLRRLGVRKISKTLSSKRETQEDFVTRDYGFYFNREVFPYAIIEILSQLGVIERVDVCAIAVPGGGPQSLIPRTSQEEQRLRDRADCFHQQRYLQCLDSTSATWAQGAWYNGYDGFGQRIVVIDESIDSSKAPDIANKWDPETWDPFEECGGPWSWHGAVMAVIAAGDGSGGWWGVAPGAQLAHIGMCFPAPADTVVKALDRYIEHVLQPGDIVLMAWDMGYDARVENRIATMYSRGVWMFSPDETYDPDHYALGEYPAAFSEVFGVSGADMDGNKNSGTGGGLDTRCMAAHWDVPIQVQYPYCGDLTQGSVDVTASRATAVMAGVAALVASQEGGDLYAKLDAHCWRLTPGAYLGCILAVPEMPAEDIVTFLADRTETGPVVVAWTTQVEHAQGYFLLSRSGISPTGPWTPTDSTATLGGLHSGANYEIVDGSAPTGDLWYRLEQVDGVTGAHFEAGLPCKARPPGWRDRLGDRLAQSDSTGIPPRAHAAGQLSRAAGANSGE